MSKIYAIRNKESGEFVSYNSKCAWSKAGNAKNAFTMHQPYSYSTSKVKFDDQGEFEIIELTEYYFMYKDLCK